MHAHDYLYGVAISRTSSHFGVCERLHIDSAHTKEGASTALDALDKPPSRSRMLLPSSVAAE